MTGPNDDDLDILAGEYVLGTLTGAARDAFEAKMETDQAARTAVIEWTEELQPLAEALPPEAPPPHVWTAIQAEISALNATSNVLPFKQNPAPARRYTWLSFALAASLLLAVITVPQILRKPDIIATIELAAATGQAIYHVDLADHNALLLVTPLRVTLTATQSHELWIVPKTGAPVSLGLLDAHLSVKRTIPEAVRSLLAVGATLAISLEPKGGSPTGAPTGPVLFTGHVMALASHHRGL